MKKLSLSSLSFFIRVLRSMIYIGIGIVIILSYITFIAGDATQNCFGLFGHYLAVLLRTTLGMTSMLVGGTFITIGIQIGSSQRVITKLEWVCWGIFLVCSSLLFAVLSTKIAPANLLERWVSHGTLHPYLGGVFFQYLYSDLPYVNALTLLGEGGVWLLCSSGILFSWIVLTHARPWAWLKTGCITLYALLQRAFHQKKGPTPTIIPQKHIREPRKESKILSPRIKASPSAAIFLPSQNISYHLPPSTLLTVVKKQDDTLVEKDLKNQAAILEETLLSFGIEAKVGQIHCGPTIVSFEVHPSIGVKVQKIKALESDIALNMQAKSIRIIAPIPGKAAVGIEVPSSHPQEVSFRELLEFYQEQEKKCMIPLLLGKVVNGDPLWTDLAKMPHLIIAGATGSGKSVCINTMVMSMVMNASPEEIKLIIVDPKKVELTAYSQLPHMLAPVVTEPKEAHAALLWLVKEMERRYELFRRLGIRHLHAFNHRTPNLEIETTMDSPVPSRLPLIVCIIDELADLMMTASSDIETPIARIAQMARAVGIHLVLATQRPSREVITGLIKANFPTRIAFKVASRVNSQIIIDDNGAEMLLGNGDMLFMPPGTSLLLRAQGAFIRDEDINRVIEFICQQAPPQYLIQSFQDNTQEQDFSTEPHDALYEQAKTLVLETRTASTTFLQRKLKVGYARAASLMDQLEQTGVVGPSQGAKPRKIFSPYETE